jgi:hypothetical protein
MDDERREELLEDVAVFLKQEGEEFLGIVRDEIDFQAIADAGFLDRFVRGRQADDFVQR